jgi:hypothetical protein
VIAAGVALTVPAETKAGNYGIMLIIAFLDIFNAAEEQA